MRYRPFEPRFFIQNRKALASKLDSDSLALVFSADVQVRNGDQSHPWRQDSNFFYLTGLEQPGLKLVLIPDRHSGHQEILFIPKADPKKEKWEGHMLTAKEATERSGVKKVMYNEDFDTFFFVPKN